MLLRQAAGTRGVLPQRAQNEQGIVRLDAVFLDAHAVARDAVPQQKILRRTHGHVAAAEKRFDVFTLEVAVHVHVGALRVHQHSAGIVLHEERDKEALVGHLLPLAAVSRLLKLPCRRPIVITVVAGDARRNGRGAHRHSAKFDKPHRRAANLRERGIQHQPLELQHAKSAIEQVDANRRAHGTPHGNLRLIP